MKDILILFLVVLALIDILYYIYQEQKYKIFEQYWNNHKKWWEFWR